MLSWLAKLLLTSAAIAPVLAKVALFIVLGVITGGLGYLVIEAATDINRRSYVAISYIIGFLAWGGLMAILAMLASGGPLGYS